MSTADLLLANLERLLSSPTSAGTIRKLIFDLAIRGQLTTQSDKDEPASVLIARVIRTAQDEDRKFSAEPVVTEKPFEVPSGWEWVRLGNTGKIFNGTSASAGEKIRLSKTTDGLPFIATKDVGYGRDPLCYENGLKVPHGDKDYKVAKTGAVLICAEGGSAGKKVGQTDRPICFGNKLYANETWDGIEPRYILSLYQSNFFYGEFKGKMAGIIGGIARSDFRGLRIPLPPIAEQKRIVAKVDELMALCDRLEAQLKERDVKQAALAKAALAKFTEDPTPENLQLLFHPSFSVEPKDIRKTVLTLAINGTLTRNTPGAIAATASLPIVPLGSLLTDGPTNGVSPKAVSHDTGVKSLSLSATTSGVFKGEHFKFVPLKVPADSNLWLKDGDLLIQRSNSLEKVGTSAIYRGKPNQFIYPDLMMKMRLSELADVDYVQLVLCEQRVRQYFRGKAVGTSGNMPKIGQETVKNTPIPLPSLDDQRAIIEKVKRIDSIIDQLEAQLEASRTTGEKLLEAMVAELTAA
jgi:type I restriction enzyme S subunit